jgi:hypothetical protein
MTNFSHKEGYKNSLGTGLSYEGLASSDFNTIPISVDAASRDMGNPDATVHLRPYLAMGYDTSTGRYKPFNSAVHAQATVVVLAEEARDMDQVVSNVSLVAFVTAIFKSSVIIVPGGQSITWSNVQRIVIRDNV